MQRLLNPQTEIDQELENITCCFCIPVNQDIRRIVLCDYFTVEFYQPLFDLDSDEFFYRLLYSLNPFQTKFKENALKKPDLYGPLWIILSLIFIIAVCGNYIKHLQGQKNYDFEIVQIALGVFIGSCVFSSIFSTMVVRNTPCQLEILQFICIYGYSNSIYIVVSLLITLYYYSYIYQSQYVVAIILGYGSLSAYLFIINNFKDEIQGLTQQTRNLMYLENFFMQGIIFGFCYFYFFQQTPQHL